MFFERFYNTDLAQASYMLGCQKTGESLVIDAVRDVHQYLETAKKQNLRITHVSETHIHADYLSGSRELAKATGAQLLLSDEGDSDWKYEFECQKLYHNDVFTVGHLKIEVRHTPGHTPEHICFLVTDTVRGDQPVMFFTGDFVFVGEIGRPDLLDEAAGGHDTRFVGAQQMFKSLQEQFLSLPDHVQVWPAHGAGSACGKALGAVPSTTVGYERHVSWWSKYLGTQDNQDEQGFINELLSGQPDAPLYYGRMKMQNKMGPALLGEVLPLSEVDVTDRTQLRLIDSRPREEYQAAAPKNSVNLPVGNTFETWAGWLLRPEDADYALIARNAEQAEILRRRLWMIGLDNVKGFACHVDNLDTEATALIDAHDMSHMPADTFILDVRQKTEYLQGHIPHALQLHAGRLPWKLDELPQDKTIVLHCQAGARSAAAASFLRAQGFQITELAGGYQAWANVHEHKNSHTK